MGCNRWRTCLRDAQHEIDIRDKRMCYTLHAHSDGKGMRTSAYEELLAHKPRDSASSDQILAPDEPGLLEPSSCWTENVKLELDQMA